MQNIDQSIRDKFENFAPAPPPHIWEGVLQGVAAQAKPAFFVTYGKQIAVAASVLLLAALGLWWILPDSSDETTQTEIIEIQAIEEMNATAEEISSNSEIESTEFSTKESGDVSAVISDGSGADIQEIGKAEKTGEVAIILSEESSKQIPESTLLNEEVTQKSTSNTTLATASSNIYFQSEIPELPQQNISTISMLAAIPLALENKSNTILAETSPVATEIIFENPPKSKGKWSSGIYLTAEFMLNDFDSVQLLPTYSLNYEPTYHFNKHFFLRFGVGMAYTRDRGFAHIDYISNEVVGTYEDVYDITFDSIDGVVVPTYHTKTTEVWDSVQHLQVSEITNKYLYLQTPVLFGYYKKETKFNWYVYGGPAFNVLVSKQIDNPQDGLEGVDIIDLDNNLPERSPYFMQLWVGAGIEYKVGKNIALSIEPNYRYYFNNVYKNDSYKTALSSFSLRFGVVFTMK